MSIRLTTIQITEAIKSGHYPSGEWEDVIELHTASSEEERDAVTAARFLEHWYPGETWYPREFHRLMYAHFTSRWPSAAEIGAIRAREAFEDGAISKVRLDQILSSDEEAAGYVRLTPGCKVFEDTDGSVLTFNGLYQRADLANTSG